MAKFAIASPMDLARFHAGGVVLVRPGTLAGLRPDDCFGHSPQAECDKADRRHPEDQRAAGLGGKRRQGAGLVGIAAGPEGDADDDVRDQQVQHAAGDETRARRVFERIAVCRAIRYPV